MSSTNSKHTNVSVTNPCAARTQSWSIRNSMAYSFRTTRCAGGCTNRPCRASWTLTSSVSPMPCRFWRRPVMSSLSSHVSSFPCLSSACCWICVSLRHCCLPGVCAFIRAWSNAPSVPSTANSSGTPASPSKAPAFGRFFLFKWHCQLLIPQNTPFLHTLCIFCR